MPPGPAPTIPTHLGVLTWRPRTEDDHGLLRALFASSRRAELDLLGGDADQQRAFVDLQLRARERHRDATRPGADLLVLTLDDIAVGQLDLHRSPTGVEVLEIALVPGLRGHGLGTAVLARVLATADDDGVPVRLHVESANPARRLYERLGFAVVGTEGLHLAMARPSGDAGAEADPSSSSAPTPTSPTPDARPAVQPPDPAAMPAYEDLAARVGSAVPCLPDGPRLELVAVDARPRPDRAGPVPFSALLSGPADQPLAQGLHLLQLPGSEPLDLFLVPLAPEAGRARYELVFA